MRLLLILFAILLAGAAGLGVQRILSQDDPAPTQAAPRTEVLVVTADMPIGGLVSQRMLAWQSWPDETLNPRYIIRTARPDALEQIAGAAARQPIFAGEPVTEGKLVKRTDKSFLALILGEGRRAVAVKVDEATGISGLIEPGDRVDVVLTHHVPVEGASRKEHNVTEVIAANLRVLAVDQALKAEEDKKTMYKVVTLEADPHEAAAVSLGRVMGNLSLVLRAAFLAEAEAKTAPVTVFEEDISSALRAAQAAPPPAAEPPPPRPDPVRRLRIVRGMAEEIRTLGAR